MTPPAPAFVSASGLRPLGAFVVIGAVVVAVAVRVSALASAGEAPGPPPVRSSELGPPAYAIEDPAGRPLARTVRRIDLVVSPRSVWQAHTPDHMARVVAEATGGLLPADELLARFLPDARDGVITIDDPDWSLGARQALAVGEWILGGRRAGRRPIAGLWLERDAERPGRHRLCWEPAVTLSRATREEHGLRSPIRWTRRLADGLAAAVWDDDAVAPGGDEEALRDQRQRVWRALVPRGLTRAIVDLPADRALAVRSVLEAEGVRPHQMKLEVGSERVYPCGEFGWLGDWGYVRPEQREPRPRGGLELHCAGLLHDPELDWIRDDPAGYLFREARVPRRPVRPYFVSATPGSEAPVFRTTIDTRLALEVRRRLEECLAEHRAALAMAAVVEVETGAVLALDAVQAYGFQGFSPSMYLFTPGSTFKALTMAIALDEGVVRPDELVDVGHGGAWRLEGSTRVIHEAEGHAEGVLTATECLTESMNAGLVQIGLRIDSRAFRARLLELGYGRPPGLGLGPERGGTIPALATAGRSEGLWSRNWSHASVCFGHEIGTTLTQHATALAALVRGGEWRPLSLVASVAQRGRWQTLEPPEARRVFRPETAAEVRRMMQLAAREGTGQKVYREGLSLGTKTGTTEKVRDEVCAHRLGEATDRALATGTPFDEAAYRALRGLRPDDHATCYTSSMAAFGRLPGSDRECLVVVVVEEPRAGARYGSEVAGPTAVALLEEALGVTVGGREHVADVAPGFAPAPAGLERPEWRPWHAAGRGGAH